MTLSPEDIEGYHAAFNLFDKANTGFISKQEFAEVLRMAGQNPTN